LAAQFYLLLILVAGVAVASGWLYRGRRDAAIIDRLQADLGQYKVREAVLEERGLRVDEVQARYVECNEQLQAARSEAAQLATALEVASSELKSQQVLASEKQQLLRLNQLEFRQQFELHARKNLEGCNDRLAAMAEDRLNSLLVPLREQLGDFKRRVEETYDRDSQDRHQLKAEIAQLKTLNERISNDAINLTNALRGNNKSLGTWGELVLERVLERPGGRDVIIDAKVSIKAFEKAHAERTDKAARNRWMRLHVKSIRTHIETLSVKEYERIDAVNSLDFVILFVPVEAAFQAAVEFDGGLYKDAFDRDVVLVGPASLMVTCRTIQNVWRTEMQHRNALQIARKAGDLIDKFIAFTRDLDKVGESLSVASNAYDQARRRLSSGRGNLMSRAKTIQQLGAIGKEQV